MKKFILLLGLTLVLTGCSTKFSDSEFQSYYLKDEEVYEEVTSSGALFAYKTEKFATEFIQELYIWDAQLRSDIKDDLTDIYLALDNKPIIISVEFNKVSFSIEGKNIDMTYSSEESAKIIDMMFPRKFNVEQTSFKLELAFLIGRLETTQDFGLTELVVIETRTVVTMPTSNLETDVFYFVNEI